MPTVAAVAVALVLAITAVAQGGESTTLAAYEAVLVATAIALLADLERGRWSQGAVTGLVVDLGDLWEPVTLRDRLARALGDPSLQLGYRLGDRYADEAGRPVALPAPGGERAVTPVDADGERVAVLIHDRTVLEDPELVEAVAAATRLAVTNVRLQAEVLARAEQLAASRRRIVEAADAQRRRLQQELSEGAERAARLAWRPRSRRSRRRSATGVPGNCWPTSSASSTPRARSCASSLAAFIRPHSPRAGSPPRCRSWRAARVCRSSCASTPAARRPRSRRPPTSCARRRSPTSPSTRAQHAPTISARREPGRLVVTITDDGAGGADPARGSGLRGLADRVEALGGRLIVESPPGAGTRLEAELPAP